jgi:hypothetical protein
MFNAVEYNNKKAKDAETKALQDNFDLTKSVPEGNLKSFTPSFNAGGINFQERHHGL